ncbi:hypothetical protein EHS25_005541 [Saitozyma podzolica]|jgi:hypothetical protein|uniref:Uncharacterized protein n=1 Tax=Saitozyma podzolica TaxID=1890683 RepID=A0A427XXX6_9TREE|nr:hypothetical protein EHS25_005541 [Saitozyma podzolica]
MDAATGNSATNLSTADCLALLRSLMADDSDSEDDAQTGTENEGGPNIISHQGAVFIMDTARRLECPADVFKSDARHLLTIQHSPPGPTGYGTITNIIFGPQSLY